MSGIPRKALILVLDGVSDRPVGGRTPLQAARTPNLDTIAHEGICGILDVIAPGVRPGSDTAHLALLGYDPYRHYTGRGPLEAAGVGMEVRPGDVAFRCNFAWVDGDAILDRRAGRISDTDALAQAIQREVRLPVQFEFRRSTGHRGVLLLRGEGLSAQVGDTDAHENGTITESEPLVADAARTAEIVNSFVRQCRDVLGRHPQNEKRRAAGLSQANAVLTRGAGVVPDIPPFQATWGLNGALVASVGLILGIGRLCGLDVIGEVSATSPAPPEMVVAAVGALERHDLVLLNIKGADEFGHDGDFAGKATFIERVDEAVASLRSLEDTAVVVTADHSTPVAVRNHSADPTPLVIAGDGVRTDTVKRFDEVSCAEGGLGRLRGLDLIPILADLMDRTRKFGA